MTSVRFPEPTQQVRSKVGHDGACLLAIPGHPRQRQEDLCQFQVSLVYIVISRTTPRERPSFKQQNNASEAVLHTRNASKLTAHRPLLVQKLPASWTEQLKDVLTLQPWDGCWEVTQLLILSKDVCRVLSLGPYLAWATESREHWQTQGFTPQAEKGFKELNGVSGENGDRMGNRKSLETDPFVTRLLRMSNGSGGCNKGPQWSGLERVD